MNKSEKNIHSSHARLKTKTSDQLVDIANYVSASLKVNDKHTMHMYLNMCNDKFANIQTGLLHIGTTQMNVRDEYTIYDLYAALTMLEPKLC